MRNILFKLLIAGTLLIPASVFAADLLGTIPVKKIKIDKSKTAKRYPGLVSGSSASNDQLSSAVVFLEGDTLKSDRSEERPELRQENLQFEPRVLAVERGTTVRFPNYDSVFHNVFSYSSAKRFDLGRYANGEYRDEVFDSVGVVRVYCEIHSHMRGFIVVVPNSYFAVTDDSGSFSIGGIPAGSYQVVVWREGAKPLRAPVTVTESTRVRLSLDDSAISLHHVDLNS